MKWITFSRGMGTHGTEIAKQVASELGYRLYDTKAINHTARELGLLESVREIDEKTPSIVQRAFSQRPLVYLERLYSVIYEMARQGDAVFLGRGSHILLREFSCALHVRVTASLETRIGTLTSQGLNREAAARAIAHSDRERGGFVKFAFGVDWEDPARYDIVLNMDKLSVPMGVSTVLAMAKSSDITDTAPETLQSLEALALSSRAQAALVEAAFGHAFMPALSVAVVAPGRVQVSGNVETQANRAEAEAILRSVKGIHSVENAIQVIPPITGA